MEVVLEPISQLDHYISKLNFKTVSVFPSLDPSLIFPFHLAPFLGAPYRIFLLFLPWLPCHFYLVVIEQQQQSSVSFLCKVVYIFLESRSEKDAIVSVTQCGDKHLVLVLTRLHSSNSPFKFRRLILPWKLFIVQNQEVLVPFLVPQCYLWLLLAFPLRLCGPAMLSMIKLIWVHIFSTYRRSSSIWSSSRRFSLSSWCELKEKDCGRTQLPLVL